MKHYVKQWDILHPFTGDTDFLSKNLNYDKNDFQDTKLIPRKCEQLAIQAHLEIQLTPYISTICQCILFFQFSDLTDAANTYIMPVS